MMMGSRAGLRVKHDAGPEDAGSPEEESPVAGLMKQPPTKSVSLKRKTRPKASPSSPSSSPRSAVPSSTKQPSLAKARVKAGKSVSGETAASLRKHKTSTGEVRTMWNVRPLTSSEASCKQAKTVPGPKAPRQADHGALVKLTFEKEMLAEFLERSIRKFIEVRAEPRSLHAALVNAQSLIKLAMEDPDSRDELFMQLLKQTRSHGGVAALRAWELLLLVSVTMPPTRDYKAFVAEYVDAVCRLDIVRPHIRKVARKVQAALASSLSNGMRTQPPTVNELEAQVLGNKLSVPVTLIDGSSVRLPYEIGTTVASCIPLLGQLIGLDNYGTFALFESCQAVDPEGGVVSAEAEHVHVPIDNERYLADVLQDSRLGRDSQVHARKELVFKKLTFTSDDTQIREPRFHELCYLQVQRDYLKGLYVLEPKEAIWLTALQVQAHRREAGIDDLLTSSRELELIVQQYSPAELFLSESQWINKVIDCCARIANMEKAETWRHFLGIIGRKPFGKSAFFSVTTLADPLKVLTPSTTIAVNRKGVHLFREEPYELKLSIGLQEVMHYGSNAKAAFFKVKRSERLLIFQFGTTQGPTICNLLQLHINHAFMRRFKARVEFIADTLQVQRQAPEWAAAASRSSQSLATIPEEDGGRSPAEISPARDTDSSFTSPPSLTGVSGSEQLPFVLRDNASDMLADALEDTTASGSQDGLLDSTQQSFYSVDMPPTSRNATRAALLEAQGDDPMSSDVELALLKDSLNAAVAERDAAVNTLTQLQTQSTEEDQKRATEVEALAIALEEAERVTNELQEANDQLQTELRRTNASKGVSYELFAAVQEQLDNSLAKTRDTQLAATALQEKLSAAEQRERVVAAKLSQAESARGSAHSDPDEVTDLQASVAKLQAQLLLASGQKAEAERKASTAKQNEQGTEARLEALVTEHEAAKAAAAAQAAELQAQLDSVKEDLAAARQQAPEPLSAEAEAQLAEIREQLEAAKRENEELTIASEKLKVETEAAAVREAKASEKLEATAAQIEDMRQKAAAAEAAGVREAEAVKEMAAMEADLRTANGKLAGLEEELEGARKEAEQLRTAAEESKAQLEAAAQHKAETSEQLAAMTAQIEDLQQKAAKAEAAGIHEVEAVKKLAALEEEVGCANQNAAAATAAASGLEAQLAAMTQQLGKAEQRSVASEAVAREAEEQMESLAGRLSELQQQLAAAEAQQPTETATAENSPLDSEAAAAGKVSELEARVAQRETRIDSLLMECQKLKQELQIARAETNAGLQDSLAAAEVEAAAARRELAAAKAETERLVARVREAEIELQKRGQQPASVGQLDEVGSAMVFELWRIDSENEMLRQRTQEYEQDVERLISTAQLQLGHQNAKQKLQYHLSWKKDLEALRHECTTLLRERFQLEQCVRYLAVRCGLATTTTDVTATQWRDALASLQPASLAVSSVRNYTGHHATRLPDLKLAPSVKSQEPLPPSSKAPGQPGSSSGVESVVEQNILQRVAVICSPQGSKIESETKKSGPDSRIVTTSKPKRVGDGEKSDKNDKSGEASSSRAKASRAGSKLGRPPTSRASGS